LLRFDLPQQGLICSSRIGLTRSIRNGFGRRCEWYQAQRL